MHHQKRFKKGKIATIGAMTVALTTIGTSVNVATANTGTQNSIEAVDKATSIAGNSHTSMDRSVSDPHSGSSVHLPNSPEEPTRLTDKNSGTLSLYGHQGSLNRGRILQSQRVKILP